jgi:hypothetical protein
LILVRGVIESDRSESDGEEGGVGGNKRGFPWKRHAAQ